MAKGKTTDATQGRAHGLEYLVRRPRDAAAPPPLLCFLHGYDEGAPTDVREGVIRHGPLRRGTPAIAEQFIVVAPQLPRKGDFWDRHAGAVVRLVEDECRRWNGDASRVYLTGFSFGGNGVFDLALREESRWAALWSVDPTRVPLPLVQPLFLSVGEAARHIAPGIIGVLGLHRAREQLAGDRLFLDEGLDHVGCATSAYRDARIYRWLLDKRL